MLVPDNPSPTSSLHSLLLFTLLLPTSSFAAVIISTTTNGCHLTRIGVVETSKNMLSQLTYMIVFLMRTGWNCIITIERAQLPRTMDVLSKSHHSVPFHFLYFCDTVGSFQREQWFSQKKGTRVHLLQILNIHKKSRLSADQVLVLVLKVFPRVTVSQSKYCLGLGQILSHSIVTTSVIVTDESESVKNSAYFREMWHSSSSTVYTAEKMSCMVLWTQQCSFVQLKCFFHGLRTNIEVWLTVRQTCFQKSRQVCVRSQP